MMGTNIDQMDQHFTLVSTSCADLVVGVDGVLLLLLLVGVDVEEAGGELPGHPGPLPQAVTATTTSLVQEGQLKQRHCSTAPSLAHSRY